MPPESPPSTGIEAICRSLDRLSEPVRARGATPAARALVVARLFRRRREAGIETPLVVICPDEDSAADFLADLETLGSTIERIDIPSCQFPGWEHSPYSPIAPSIRVRLARVAVLSQLSRGGSRASLVIATTLDAICQAGIPRPVFEQHSIALRVGESVGSREELLRRLAEAGYPRVDPVEDPGTCAARGDIVDVFPPGREKPVRIELFDDVIERLRDFNPATQRTETAGSTETRELVIPPAREVLINSVTVARVRERLKERADDLGIPRGTRDPVLASVLPGSYPEHCDAWASFAYEDPATLMDHLPAETPLIWLDEFSCRDKLEQHVREERGGEGPESSGLILPAREQILLWSPELDARVRKGSRLFLDQITLTSGADPAGPDRLIQLSVNGTRAPGATSPHPLASLEPRLRLWQKQGYSIVALASTQSQLERARFLLEERGFQCHPEPELPPTAGIITLRVGTISDGFQWPAEGLVVLSEGDLLGSRAGRRRRRAATAESGSAARDWSGLQALSDLAVGDAVVHVDHGIGRYQGLARLDLSGAPSDFLLLEYANRDKLYLPVYRLNAVQKYVGSGESITLDRLGSQLFTRAKEKVREAVKRLAVDLVRLYAERKVRPGARFEPRDALYREFEAAFPFEETPDQLKAIEQVHADLESGRSMDRLVCGDVGYGKTEVAIRAAFRAVSNGKQVAVLVPTTVLAFQHEQSFRTRMKDHPLLIESVSRFKTATERRKILGELASGKVDIIIGTHRLLSSDVRFRDLGLVIVDEEHRFGVEHKEKLKALRANAHVLTLTATPIPRTLHMALAGLRDISLINTPPVDRHPIRTFVSRYDEELIQRAITMELERGGQAFFLHNRVQSIFEMANTLRGLCPRARIGVAHGQMAEGELEKAMVAFYQRKTNVLVCTTIIESGLDIPSANTIVINRADSLGLAQLYQIRGRVGRGEQRAHAYLLIPSDTAVTDDARRRLEVIQRFVELGSGFSVASHDLEIRGGGDLLGPQQSGHIAAVGFDLYTELLEEAIRELRSQGDGSSTSFEPSRREPEIKAPFPAFLAEAYVPDIHQRLSLYRRFSAAGSEAEVILLEEELLDRFGPPPEEARNLLWMIRIKILLKAAGIESLTVGPEKISLVGGPHSGIDPARAISLMASDPASYQLAPDSRLVARIATGTLRDLYFALETLLGKLL